MANITKEELLKILRDKLDVQDNHDLCDVCLEQQEESDTHPGICENCGTFFKNVDVDEISGWCDSCCKNCDRDPCFGHMSDKCPANRVASALELLDD